MGNFPEPLGVPAASMPFRNGKNRLTENEGSSGFRRKPVPGSAFRGENRRRGRKAAFSQKWETHVGHVYGTERIPWPIRPKKGAEDCEKPREAVNRRYTRGCPNGGTHRGESSISFLGWTPTELKYLSKWGKEIKIRDSRSSDERNGKSPNQVSAKLRSVAYLVL